jgi:hypothetical protein
MMVALPSICGSDDMIWNPLGVSISSLLQLSGVSVLLV